MTPQAEGYFEVTQGALLSQGAKQDAVLLNLDLGYWLSRDGKWQKLEKLARETWQLASAAGYQAEKLAALKQWCAAVEARVELEAALREAYREVRGISLPRPSQALPELPAAPSRWASSGVGW